MQSGSLPGSSSNICNDCLSGCSFLDQLEKVAAMILSDVVSEQNMVAGLYINNGRQYAVLFIYSPDDSILSILVSDKLLDGRRLTPWNRVYVRESLNNAISQLNRQSLPGVYQFYERTSGFIYSYRQNLWIHPDNLTDNTLRKITNETALQFDAGLRALKAKKIN